METSIGGYQGKYNIKGTATNIGGYQGKYNIKGTVNVISIVVPFKPSSYQGSMIYPCLSSLKNDSFKLWFLDYNFTRAKTTKSSSLISR